MIERISDSSRFIVIEDLIMDVIPMSQIRMWKNKAEFFRPFSTAAAAAGEKTVAVYDPAMECNDPDEPDLRQLNAGLAALIDIFPNIEPAVFREMLTRVSNETRLQIITDELLRKQAECVRGRYRTPPTGKDARPRGGRLVDDSGVADDESFRTDVYKTAVKQVFYQEFRNLSHSSIKAVLAEQNFSYALARPILQQLSARSWRFTFSSLWWKRPTSSWVTEHPNLTYPPGFETDPQAIPQLNCTGSTQLDRELYELFVSPVATAKRQLLLTSDFDLASQLNETEAEESDALFDCECCYDSVPFEQVAFCTDHQHQLCFECLRRTVQEALFGQGWSRTIDTLRGTVCCLAPTTTPCMGVIPAAILRRALYNGRPNEEAWQELQTRLALDVITKSRLPLQRCPFCPYAEIIETPRPRLKPAKSILTHIAATHLHRFLPNLLLLSLMVPFPLSSAPIFLLTTLLIPLLLLSSLLLPLCPHTSALLHASWTRIHRSRLPTTFTCRNPACASTTCTRCHTRTARAHWPCPPPAAAATLRAALEASTSQAVKRTCPRCLLSFVKDSGCNKLVCPCGYTMCYVCRAEVSVREGYAHFCQHFRPGGDAAAARCELCDRCDLYRDEDETAVIRQAAKEAERAWLEGRRGGAGQGEVAEHERKALMDGIVDTGRGQRGRRKFWTGTWEECLDAVVDAMLE